MTDDYYCGPVFSHMSTPLRVQVLAIGFLASGTNTASGNLYLQLTNDSGGALSGLTVGYDVEKYRNGILALPHHDSLAAARSFVHIGRLLLRSSHS